MWSKSLNEAIRFSNKDFKIIQVQLHTTETHQDEIRNNDQLKKSEN